MPKLSFLVFCVSTICSTLTYAADLQNTDCDKEIKKLREAPIMLQALDAMNRIDINRGIKYYKLAIQENNPRAMLVLGMLYHGGKLTPQNDTEAIRLIKSAAEQGYCEAQNTFGFLYESGEMVNQNFEEALLWHKAAAQGSDDAWGRLSRMYKYGQGTSINYVKAHMWMNLRSARYIPEVYGRELDRLEKRMTRQQISQAHKLAAQCLASNFKQCD